MNRSRTILAVVVAILVVVASYLLGAATEPPVPAPEPSPAASSDGS